MRRASSLLSLLLAVSLPAQEPPGVLPYRYHLDDLPNGLRLITIPTPFPEIVSVYVVVSVGSRNELEAGKTGFAHFFEHMMFRGTKSRTSAEQAAVFKRIGAARNAYTSDDLTVYHTTFGKQDLETVLELEADRFMNLEYSQKDFRTEAMAVFGEYNKNSANPYNKLQEVLRDTAFTTHTYKHTTMGFLADIVAMPKQYEYSRQFFARWYKPECTTLLVVGDVTRERVLPLVEKHWGAWQKGLVPVTPPAEPAQGGPKTVHVPWPTPTQPWVTVAFKGPAIDDSKLDMPALDVVARTWFGPSSDLYQRLYVKEQKVDALFASFPDHVDPYLLQVVARVRKNEDVSAVRDAILATCERAKTEPVDTARLDAIKKNLRYSFVGGLTSSDAIAGALAGYVARARTPETVDRIFRLYEKVRDEDLRAMARRWFKADERTIATLAHGELPKEAAAAAPGAAGPASRPASAHAASILAQPSESPLVTFRVLLKTGSASDPKPGLSALLARFLVSSSTKKRSYEQIVKDLYPMAASVDAQVDKDMTVFSGTVHKDNLEPYFATLKEMLREPAWKEEDLARVKQDMVAFLDDELRRSNDEELGKEVLQSVCFAGTPYERYAAGAIEAIQSVKVEDLKALHERWFLMGLPGPRSQPDHVVGIAGGFPSGFDVRAEDELFERTLLDMDVERTTWVGLHDRAAIAAKQPTANTLTIVKKPTRATGIHIGFPIEVTRSHPDFAALWLARSWLGEHRSENSHLYQRLRETRGLNYGDYAYVEYFPRGMFQFQPDPNLARRAQVFEIWIRPVPPEHGQFALRAAWYELNKLVQGGLTQEQFEATRSFLKNQVALLVDTQDARLGYALDARAYGIGEFVPWMRKELDALTVEKVNAVITKHLRTDRLHFVVVTADAERFRDDWLQRQPAEITYQARPADTVLEEDKVIRTLAIPLAAKDVRIVPVEDVFAR